MSGKRECLAGAGESVFQPAPCREENEARRCPEGIGHNVIELAESPPGDQLHQFEACAAEQSGENTYRRFSESRGRQGQQDAEGDEHEDVLDKKGMGDLGRAPCLKGEQTDSRPRSRLAGKESQFQENAGIYDDEKMNEVLLHGSARGDLFHFRQIIFSPETPPGMQNDQVQDARNQPEGNISDRFHHVVRYAVYQ